MQKVPKDVRHRARICAKVTINSKVHYLPGEFNSPESKAAYGRLIAETLTNPNGPETTNVTLRFLATAYLKYCREFYLDNDGRELNEVRQIKLAVKPLLEIFGRESAYVFGPRELKLVRERISETGVTRGVINERVGRIENAELGNGGRVCAGVGRARLSRAAKPSGGTLRRHTGTAER